MRVSLFVGPRIAYQSNYGIQRSFAAASLVNFIRRVPYTKLKITFIKRTAVALVVKLTKIIAAKLL